MLHVIDHTEPGWAAKYARHGRPNGAETYSRDLVAHQVPVWQDAAGQLDVTVSTCPVLSTVRALPGGDLAVQYLHTYSYVDPVRQARMVTDALGGKYRRFVFLTAYRPLAHQLTHAGFPAAWVPMTIDVDAVRAVAAAQPTARTEGRRVAYYGNLVGPKARLWPRLRRELTSAGWKVDHVTGPQEETLPRLAAYRYGIGVGRCALEMAALGVRVMVAGGRFGGLVTSLAEFDVQRSVNFNGRVVTFDRSLLACAATWDQAMPWPASDIDAAAGAAAVSAWVDEHAGALA